MTDEKPWGIIVDIDGTLAKMDGRHPFEFDRVDEDKCNEPIAELVRDLYEIGYQVVIVSGRTQTYDCHSKTREWLKRHHIPFHALFMRAEDDKRPDNEIKQEIFEQYINECIRVAFVLDDRDKVVAMWRSLGLTCLQVDYGNF